MVLSRAATTPLSIAPSQYWDGNDGQWSSFFIQVGTPPQSVRLFPSTSENAIWVVLSEGCTAQDPTDCSDSRGLIYHADLSSSWSQFGTHYTRLYGAASSLGYSGNAEYALDKVTLGYPGSGAPAVGSQIIEGFAAQFPYLGVLGLNPQVISLTDLQDSHTSFISNLYTNGTIPSPSWGYTAGAVYNSPPVFGSLMLGGYDTTRFQPNNISIPFGADISRDLLVGVKSITSNASTAQLLPGGGIYAAIDSLVSTIWLPESACTAFEQAFNLTWDNVTQAYLLDNSTRASLLQRNPIITFTFSAALSDSAEVDIILPYSAFDLQLGLPYVNQETYYFPLQRAQNGTQYTLGWVVLQEAYDIADYTRRNFSIS